MHNKVNIRTISPITHNPYKRQIKLLKISNPYFIDFNLQNLSKLADKPAILNVICRVYRDEPINLLNLPQSGGFIRMPITPPDLSQFSRFIEIRRETYLIESNLQRLSGRTDKPSLLT